MNPLHALRRASAERGRGDGRGEGGAMELATVRQGITNTSAVSVRAVCAASASLKVSPVRARSRLLPIFTWSRFGNTPSGAPLLA